MNCFVEAGEVVNSFTHRTDHDLDHLDPHLAICDVVQDLYSTDPIKKKESSPCRLHGSQPGNMS